MNNYKDKFKKLSDLEKNAIEQREEYIKKIIDDYEHLDMELSQEKRKVSNLKLKEMEHIEFINGLRAENEQLKKELKKANKFSVPEITSLTKKQIEDIHRLHQKQVDEMSEKIKTLQDKLGNKTVHLSTLAEGIKSYAEETTIEKAHTFFEALNSILIGEKAWYDNAKQLKKFFKEYNKKNRSTNTTIKNARQVIGVAEAGSTIINEKEEIE